MQAAAQRRLAAQHEADHGLDNAILAKALARHAVTASEDVRDTGLPEVWRMRR